MMGVLGACVSSSCPFPTFSSGSPLDPCLQPRLNCDCQFARLLANNSCARVWASLPQLADFPTQLQHVVVACNASLPPCSAAVHTECPTECALVIDGSTPAQAAVPSIVPSTLQLKNNNMWSAPAAQVLGATNGSVVRFQTKNLLPATPENPSKQQLDSLQTIRSQLIVLVGPPSNMTLLFQATVDSSSDNTYLVLHLPASAGHPETGNVFWLMWAGADRPFVRGTDAFNYPAQPSTPTTPEAGGKAAKGKNAKKAKKGQNSGRR